MTNLKQYGGNPSEALEIASVSFRNVSTGVKSVDIDELCSCLIYPSTGSNAFNLGGMLHN